MPLNFQELIDKTPGLTDEQKAAAKATFGIESLTTVIEEAAMHTADEAFKAEKAKLQTRWETANAEYIAMQEKVANSEATATELATAKKNLQEAQDKLKTAVPTLDLEKLTKDIRDVVTAEMTQRELGRGAIELDAVECVARHQQLFGERISAKQLVVDALAAKKDPLTYWNEKYKVADKEKEIADAAHKKELDDATAAGYAKAISEQAHPGTRTMESSKQPFWVPKSDNAKEGINPWDETTPPPEETALLGELTAARG